jgi:hypothetical protein
MTFFAHGIEDVTRSVLESLLGLVVCLVTISYLIDTILHEPSSSSSSASLSYSLIVLF